MDNDSKNTSKKENHRGREENLKGKYEDYHFMKEVIKGKPIDKKALVVRLGSIVGAAIIFGVIAAVTFAQVLPLVQKTGPTYKAPKVDIPCDLSPDESEEENTNNSEDAVGTDQNSLDGTIKGKNDSTQANANTDKADQETEETEAMGLEDYKNVYKEMMKVTTVAEKSLVTVIGITNAVDWFNNTYENQGQTAGIIVADNGKELFILTEYRIVENVDRILVTFTDGNSVDARYQKHDTNTGLTILKIVKNDIVEETRNNITTAELGNSYNVEQGEPIIAMGSPMGYSHSVAYGIVTSVTNKIAKIDTEYNLLTTDIQGSSEGSGVLLNLEGQIVGIIAQSNNAQTSKNTITAYALSQIKPLIETLSNKGEIVYVGVKGQEVTDDISQKTGIPKGIYVDSVAEDSPAMAFGIQKADIIVKIGEDSVSNIRQYNTKISSFKGGDKITVTVMRNGTEGYVEIPIDVIVEAL